MTRLIITASNVTVWLGGHTISSTDGAGTGIRFGIDQTATAAPTCVTTSPSAAARSPASPSGIAGGSCNGTGNQVSGLDLEGNTWGIYLQAGQPLGVDHTTIVGPNGIGVPLAPAAAAGGVHLSHSRIKVTSPDGFSVLSTIMRAPSTRAGSTAAAPTPSPPVGSASPAAPSSV